MNDKMLRIIIFVLNTTRYLTAVDKYVTFSVLPSPEEDCVFVRMCLHGLLVCSSVFFLIIFSFFIQCQSNLAQKERQKQGSYRQWNINKVHENVFLCKKKEIRKIFPESEKASQLKAGLQHDSLHTEATMDLQKDGQGARDASRDPETGNLLCSLHFSLKMRFIQNKALVPAVKELELGLWLKHTCG